MKKLSISPRIKDFSKNLLLAHPNMQDGEFKESIIAITRHNKLEGTMGLIINKPLGLTLSDFDEDVWGDMGDVEVYYGGPVEKGKILLTAMEWDENYPACKWYIGITKDIAQSLLREKDDVEIRAFCGYSGWGVDQLDNEIKNNAWILTPIDPNAMIESTGKSLWLSMMVKFHPLVTLYNNVPPNPLLN